MGRGVVMVITLLAIVLLAALVMFVLNLGKQTNSRIVTQHAADSAAAGGAGWVARSLNTVAMNNVGMTQLIASVQIVDAMPQTTRFTVIEQTAIRDACNGQLSRGVRSWWVSDALVGYRDAVQEELDILIPMDNHWTANDPAPATVYDNGNGAMWRAMVSMDQYNQTVMENLGVLAQLNALRGGEVNLTQDAERSAAMMVPVVPQVPWVRGHFDHFERPVVEGLLPEGADDTLIRRGPYDVLFGWRDLHGGGPIGYWVPGSTPRQVASGGKGSVPIGSGSGGNGGGGRYVQTGSTPPTHYTVYGPYNWTLRKIGWFAGHELPHSRFSMWARQISNIKIEYLWPSSGTSATTIVEPEWITDYNAARGIGDSDPSRVKETMYIAVEIKSRYPSSSASFLSPGSWAYVSEEGRDSARPTDARRVILRGWVDGADWGAPQLNQYIWRDEWQYSVYYDNDIGLSPAVDPGTGQRIAQPVYRIDEFVFVGINIGEEVPVRNPNPTDGHDGLAAPIDLDHTLLTLDAAARRQYLTYLAIAQRDDRAIMWPSRFAGNKPYPHMVAIAQANVFNNHSWDLWTQMWHAQLEPVQQYGDWVQRMTDTAGDVDFVLAIDPVEYEELNTYLLNLEPLADVMLSH